MLDLEVRKREGGKPHASNKLACGGKKKVFLQMSFMDDPHAMDDCAKHVQTILMRWCIQGDSCSCVYGFSWA